MKLFTKEINDKLFKQYPLGSDLSNQMVVAKIFNPYGKGIWFLINSDPNDPDYIWAIVSLDEVEVGSVSRRDLEQTRIGGWRLPLERDSGFRPTPALEVLKGARMGNRFDMGGSVKSNDLVGKYVWVYTLGLAEPSDNKIVSVRYSDPKFSTKSIRMTFADGAEEWIYGQDKINDFLSGRMVNLRDTTGEQYGLKLAPVYAEGGGVGDDSVLMVSSQAKEAKHHADELHNALKGEKHLDSWVVAKMERATTDLSDVTHYIDGKKEYAKGGGVGKKEMKLYRIETLSKGNKDVLTDKGDNLYIYEKGILYDTQDGYKKGTSHRMSKINLTILPYSEYAEGGGVDRYVLSFNYNPSIVKSDYLEKLVENYTKDWKHDNDWDEVTFYVQGLTKEKAKELESELKMEDVYNIEVELGRYKYAEGGGVGTLKNGDLVKYTHSPKGKAEAKFLENVGKGKVKIEILEDYRPFTKRIDDTDDWFRRKSFANPETFKDVVKRGTIKIVSSEKVEVFNPTYWSKDTIFRSKEFNDTFQDYLKGKMAKGGMARFDDKVKAISKRLVGTKVKGKYKKEYGATYDKKEAKVAATKIAGAMRAKEILAKRKKK